MKLIDNDEITSCVYKQLLDYNKHLRRSLCEVQFDFKQLVMQ